MAAGSGCGACTVTECCCETEVSIQFKVWQTYHRRGWTSQTEYGNISDPVSVYNTITAVYRGCSDQRLYAPVSNADANRVLRLDRANISLTSVPVISALQVRKAPNTSPDNGADCLAWNLITDQEPTPPSFALSTVEDSRECSCTTSLGCNAITAERAIEIGIPAEIVVKRITP
jgi:hypothetical protein